METKIKSQWVYKNYKTILSVIEIGPVVAEIRSFKNQNGQL